VLVRAAAVENRRKVLPFFDDQDDGEILRCLALTQTALLLLVVVERDVVLPPPLLLLTFLPTTTVRFAARAQNVCNIFCIRSLLLKF
jgi:hypothetical protein